MEVQSLLSRCRELGIRLSPTADGQLKVRAAGPLPDTALGAKADEGRSLD